MVAQFSSVALDARPPTNGTSDLRHELLGPGWHCQSGMNYSMPTRAMGVELRSESHIPYICMCPTGPHESHSQVSFTPPCRLWGLFSAVPR